MDKNKDKDIDIEQNKDRENETQTLDKDREQDEPVKEAIEEAEEQINKELEKLKLELEEIKDKHLRIYSEFENYKRRTAKERLELIKTANEGLIVSLLPILDDFERAEKANQEIKTQGEGKKAQKGKDGYLLIYHKFKKVLEQNGLVPMKTEKGHAFDAEIHEAVTQYPAPEDHLKGKIIEVVEKGYYLGDKVIRFAKVVVGA